MNGNELLSRLKRIARDRATTLRHDPRHGKGSHGRLWFGDRFTTMKDPRAEIGRGLLAKMLKDLGLSPEDLR